MIGIEMKLNIPVHYQMGNPLQQGRHMYMYINKSTAHGCWMLYFFVSDIKLQANYKVIHTSNLSTDWGQHFLQVYWVSS
jgi:proline dehydrogenase